MSISPALVSPSLELVQICTNSSEGGKVGIKPANNVLMILNYPTLVSFFAAIAAFFASALFSATGYADFGPSVWTQMQTNGHSRIQAKIVSLEISEMGAQVTYRQIKDGDAQATTQLCAPIGTENYRSEEMRTSLHGERITVLREALKSGQVVELGFQGPWSPCLSSIRVQSDI